MLYLYCLHGRVFIVSSPLSLLFGSPTTDAEALVIDYFVDDRTPTVELPGKQPFPSPTYRLSIYI